jgi:hypothetical protein
LGHRHRHRHHAIIAIITGTAIIIVSNKDGSGHTNVISKPSNLPSSSRAAR